MRGYAKISPKFWISGTGEKLRDEGWQAQLVALYLMSSPQANMTGLYYLPKPFMLAETGLSLDDLTKGLQACIRAGFCQYDEKSRMVWVHEMARFQIGKKLKPRDKRAIGVQTEYDNLPDNPYLQAFYDKYAVALCMSYSRMDVQMPVMDGIEATRRLRQLRQFDDLPIVALTAGALKSQQEAAIAAGMSHFVSKPFDVPAMIQLVRDLSRASTKVAALATPVFIAAAPAKLDSKILDLDQGLELWADVERYLQYLGRFSIMYRDAAEKISAYVVSGQIKAAGMLAHELAGVAASLAMPGLYQTSQEIERLVNADTDKAALDAVLDKLRNQLALVLTAIPVIGSKGGAAPSDPKNVEASLNTLERKDLLIAILKALDADDIEAVEAALEIFSQEMPESEKAKLWTQLRDFDLRGLEKTMRSLLDLEDKRESKRERSSN